MGSITPRLLSDQKVVEELIFSDLEVNDGERSDLYCFFGSEGEVVRIRVPSDAVDSYIWPRGALKLRSSTVASRWSLAIDIPWSG